MDFQRNYFELFGLPTQFDVAQDVLQQTYHQLQAQIHPDRFVAAAEKRVAMQYAAQVNEAYRVLLNPLSRAEYLLTLQGMSIEAEQNTAMAPDFLMAQLEWRESIAAAVKNQRVDQLHDLLNEIEQQIQRCIALFANLWINDLPKAVTLVREWMFFVRLCEEILQRIAHLQV